MFVDSFNVFSIAAYPVGIGSVFTDIYAKSNKHIFILFNAFTVLYPKGINFVKTILHSTGDIFRYCYLCKEFPGDP